MKILLFEEFVLALVWVVVFEEFRRLFVRDLFMLLPLVVDIGRFFARLKSFMFDTVAKSLLYKKFLALMLRDCFLVANISVIPSFLLSGLRCCTLL